MKKLIATFALTLAVLVSSGHVGDPNSYFEGKAGPYTINVVVRTPAVIPGRADVLIRVPSPGVTRVTVQAVTGQYGVKAAPRAETAGYLTQDSAYHAQLWLMTSGSYSVRVNVAGKDGIGSVFVPVTAMPTGLLGMDRGLGVLLGILGLVLVAGAVTIVGAAAREASLKPGVPVDENRRRRSAAAMAISAIVFAVIVFGGWKWWRAEDKFARRNLFTPMHTSAIMLANPKDAAISITIDDADWVKGERWSPLVPDHGKIMHLFMISEQNGFAHLHPTPVDRSNFRAVVPIDLQPGLYYMYADVVHQSGFAQTLVDTVIIQSPVTNPVMRTYTPSDPDDSWTVNAGVPSINGSIPLAMLPDGATMAWVHKRGEVLIAGKPIRLTFLVRTQDGKPAVLEPYTGMMAHAAVRKLDGSVFEHLHPAGNISVAAQQLFEIRTRDSLRTTMATPAEDSASLAQADTAMHQMSGDERPGVVRIPYAFPTPGRYRMWVQVKHTGKVLTGVFDLDVK